MNELERDDSDRLDALMYACKNVLSRRAERQIRDFISLESTQLIQEVEYFNLMNSIDLALDNRDKNAFMQLTGMLHMRNIRSYSKRQKEVER